MFHSPACHDPWGSFEEFVGQSSTSRGASQLVPVSWALRKTMATNQLFQNMSYPLVMTNIAIENGYIHS
jgi:hypothetical protein